VGARPPRADDATMAVAAVTEHEHEWTGWFLDRILEDGLRDVRYCACGAKDYRTVKAVPA